MGLFFGRKNDEVIPEEVSDETKDLEPQKAIGEKEIKEAVAILQKYKQGKANLENRIVEDELWWELRHWEAIGRQKEKEHSPRPSSAWLFNSIINKHADAMDNFPVPAVLPRERSDEQSAKTLTDILPVIMEYNNFDQVYSDNWWEKLKHGTACYGVFWNPTKDMIGDIEIKMIDLLNVYWESGITNIQDSRNLFITSMVDTDILEQMYPEHKGKMGGNIIDCKQYIYDDTVDTDGKSVVVDWYYKSTNAQGKNIVHYCKFVGNVLLFATENEPEYQDNGWYAHGDYPIVMDCLFPEKGTPIGFGLVAIDKDPQLYIDDLASNILESSMMGTKKRFFKSNSSGVKDEDFLDWTKPFVPVEGAIDDSKIREITVQPLAPIYFNVMQSKIDEMKDTSGNRDVNTGGTSGGITAASAISALQEAGNKTSRDMLNASYRAYSEIVRLVIELMRQFYDESRSFRIVGQTAGSYDFVDFNNSMIQDQMIGMDGDGNDMFRTPVFDLKIKAMKRNPFSRMEENERAKELYSMGFFNPEKATESLLALEMMDFEGIDKIKEKVQEGQTLLNLVQQLSEQNMQMAMMLGLDVGAEAPGGAEAPQTPNKPVTGSNTLTNNIMESRMPQTGYQQRLVKRSKPSID